ncbi:hypothetical protein ACFX15_013150 [Malus domestica]
MRKKKCNPTPYNPERRRKKKKKKNSDGVLSRSELCKAFKSLRLIEAHFGIDVATPREQLTRLYDSIFDKFDSNQSGTVDLEEFREEMKKIMLAIADELGSSPIQMVLEDDDQKEE